MAVTSRFEKIEESLATLRAGQPMPRSGQRGSHRMSTEPMRQPDSECSSPRKSSCTPTVAATDATALRELVNSVTPPLDKRICDVAREQRSALAQLHADLENTRRITAELTVRTDATAEQLATARRSVSPLPLLPSLQEAPCGGCIEITTRVEELRLQLAAFEDDLREGDRLRKAEAACIEELKMSVGGMEEVARLHNQPVLFGARCLSCNRVFDEVEPQVGSMDLHLEKQRAKVFAEVQKALHSTGGSHGADEQNVKIIALKVGRATQLGSSGGLGPFNGRSPASSFNALGNMQLLPVRAESSPAGGTAGSRAARRNLCTPRRQQHHRSGDGPPKCIEGLVPPSFVRGPKEGPMDYKQSLTEILQPSKRAATAA
eukprot:NODE_12429_length_1225_cov_3.606557.p1 GENE.NODE_12429_length_1225_cov_3.606557~~NODE_12429_length_1225_cov_3.606557.p1  ORF type:complete len:396 (+),score=122.38 NODE_12429_length_1225_cov_3.606557:66-1190(+)